MLHQIILYKNIGYWSQPSATAVDIGCYSILGTLCTTDFPALGYFTLWVLLFGYSVIARTGSGINRGSPGVVATSLDILLSGAYPDASPGSGLGPWIRHRTEAQWGLARRAPRLRPGALAKT